MKLKPLNQQVMVITGASSGIGLTTARMAARRGVRLALAARSGEDLRQLTGELSAAGHEAIHVEADVGNEADVRRIADQTIARFGGFDTWVNNAGGSVYGEILQVSVEDMRRVFETNFWGMVYGSRIAVEHLRGRGGALINIGSVVSDRAIPLQGIYNASKHAVKGFTDTLRMELEKAGIPVQVTLIKPGAIDTPYTEHARNYFEDAAKHIAPVYAPELVAETILHCATHATREMFVGGSAKLMSAADHYAPGITDKLMEKSMFDPQHSGRPKQGAEALHRAGGGLRERGDYPGYTRPLSLYTMANLHPLMTGAAAMGAGLLLAGWLRRQGRPSQKLLAQR